MAVLGPGAVGGSFAVRLIEAHYRTICVGPPETVGLIALAGIALEAEGAEPVTVRAEVVERLSHPVSLLLVTVKARDLDDALGRVEPDAVAGGVVLPLLNGLEHMAPLRERFDGRVAAGSLSRFEAYRVGRVQIIQTTPSAVVTMASDDLSESELERAAAILRRAGIEVEVEGDEKRVLWRKVARLAVLSVATALSGRSVGQLRTDIDWRPRMEAAISEACAVAAADGVKLMPTAQWTRIIEMDHDLTTSAARDVQAGRPSEIDAIAGAVVRAGERLGVPCPVLSELVAQAAAL
ncbi:MAG: ketopantoate reductase family protein [Gaiellaceae bacterium]